MMRGIRTAVYTGYLAAAAVVLQGTFLPVSWIPGEAEAAYQEPARYSVPFKSGNLGIADLAEAKLAGRTVRSQPDLESLKSLRRFGLVSMEDYVPWYWVEPAKNQFDWKRSDHNYRGVSSAGMKYAVHPYVHFVPEWARAEPDFQGYVCLEHNQETIFPSIWAPGTLKNYDRYYGKLKEHFGNKIEEFYVAGTADFGEIAYPVGIPIWRTPHMHEGWWINDPYAKTAWTGYLEKRFSTPQSMNTRWGTSYKTFKDVPYPRSQQNRLQWLDFMDWYRSSLTEFTTELMKLANRHFPGCTKEIKLGHPDEKLVYGTDVAGLIKAASQNGFGVRSTHASAPPEIFKEFASAGAEFVSYFASRYSTISSYYKVKLITEEVAGMDKERTLPRLFLDASIGVGGVFMGPPTYMAAKEICDRFGRFIRGDRSRADIAFYFPLTDQLLNPDRKLPKGLFNASNMMRDMMSFDIVDDALIKDGALSRYSVLAMFDNGAMTQSTVRSIETWIKGGGVLVHPFANEKLDLVDGSDAGLEKSLFSFSEEDQRTLMDGPVYARNLEKGGVVAVRRPASLSDYYHVVVKLLYQGSRLFPSMKTAPIIDTAPDKIYTAVYEDRILFFNSNRSGQSTSIVLRPSDFPVLSSPKKVSVKLEPRSIQEVQVR